MSQYIDKIPNFRRKKAIETGIETYNSVIAKDLIKHYSTEGGTPLRWVGSACAHFDLSTGDVASGARKDLIALQKIFLDGIHPTMTDANGNPIKLRQRQRSDAIAAFGFVHADPKTHGLARLYENRVLQDRLDSLHARTNKYFLNWLEKYAMDVRIDLEPNETYRCLGFIAVEATHHSSSKADPHPHDHLLIANFTPVEITTTHDDGTTSVRIEYRTLDSQLLDRMRFAAGEAATQYERHLIETELGLKTELNGDITALADADLIKEFSKARRHILKLAEEQEGLDHGMKTDELLWLMTRRGKTSADIERAFDAAWNDPKGRVQVLELWREAVTKAGNGWIEQIDLVGQIALEHIEADPEFAAPKPPPDLTPEQRAEIVNQIAKALDNRAIFTPEWVLAMTIKYGEGYWPTTEEEIDGEVVRYKGLTEQIVDEVLVDPRIVQLKPKKGTNSYSTLATLEAQADLAIALEELATSNPFNIDTIPALEAAVMRDESPDGIEWDAEQRAAFDAVFSGSGLVNWLGVAGSGKSTLVRSVADCYAKSGTPIYGFAVAGAAVQRLRNAAPGLECDTIASLVIKLNRGEKLPAGVRIIVDECYQLPLRGAELITSAVREANGQMITLGDPRQSQAIDGRGAGSLIAHVARQHNTLAELNMVYRIKSEKIKSLAAAARVGDIEGFLKVFDAVDNKVTKAEAELSVATAKTLEDHFDVIAKELGEKWKAKKPPSAVAIAYLNEDVNDLASRIQTVRWGYAIEKGETANLTSHGQYARVGDQVRTRYPIKQLGVYNGKEWQLAEVHPNGSVTLTHGKESVDLDSDYVSDHLELAYASTGHSAQGGGWKEVYGCFRGKESSTWAYNVITRPIKQLHLYAEIPVGTGDITHFWKAILKRDDEQKAALLQAEKAVRDKILADAKIRSGRPAEGVGYMEDAGAGGKNSESPSEAQPELPPTNPAIDMPEFPKQDGIDGIS
jgi:hypothetical protein